MQEKRGSLQQAFYSSFHYHQLFQINVSNSAVSYLIGPPGVI